MAVMNIEKIDESGKVVKLSSDNLLILNYATIINGKVMQMKILNIANFRVLV